jgi:hypothetical protein
MFIATSNCKRITKPQVAYHDKNFIKCYKGVHPTTKSKEIKMVASSRMQYEKVTF